MKDNLTLEEIEKVCKDAVDNFPEIFLEYYYHPEDEEFLAKKFFPWELQTVSNRLIPVKFYWSIHVPTGKIIAIGNKGTVKIILLY